LAQNKNNVSSSSKYTALKAKRLVGSESE
jgi:hypothetical protein